MGNAGQPGVGFTVDTLLCAPMFLFSPHTFACGNVSVLPIRQEPSHRSEQVSQLLFGEKVEILEELPGQSWVHVRCAHDSYQGWVNATQLLSLDKQKYDRAADFMVTDHQCRLVWPETSAWIPAGAAIQKGLVSMIGKKARVRGKKVAMADLIATPQFVVEAALPYLYAPYQWGGRTIAGIDCSGLSQMAYQLCGYSLPRDAWQQAEQGEMVDFLQYAQAGDLAFFDNEEGRINHVGILLDATTILHATESGGRVVIDKIDNGGIISVFQRRRTHNLRLVKRYL